MTRTSRERLVLCRFLGWFLYTQTHAAADSQAFDGRRGALPGCGSHCEGASGLSVQTVLFKEVCQCNRLSACREPVPGGVFVQRRGRGTLGLVQLSLEGREGRGWNVAGAVPRVGRLWVWPVSPSGHSEVGCQGKVSLAAPGSLPRR